MFIPKPIMFVLKPGMAMPVGPICITLVPKTLLCSTQEFRTPRRFGHLALGFLLDLTSEAPQSFIRESRAGLSPRLRWHQAEPRGVTFLRISRDTVLDVSRFCYVLFKR